MYLKRKKRDHGNQNLLFVVCIYLVLNSCYERKASITSTVYLMLVMSFLIESDTVLEYPASTDHCGGSLGLTARERAVWIKPVELSSIVFAAAKMGSIAA